MQSRSRTEPWRLLPECVSAGIAGVVAPPKERYAQPFADACDADLAPINFVAPSMESRHLEDACRHSRGFAYAAGVKSSPATHPVVFEGLCGFLERVRRTSGSPVFVGAGVATPEQAALAATFADGVAVAKAVFEYEGVLYRWVRPWIGTGLSRAPAGSELVSVTSPERTLVDCVRVPANAGGMEEVMRSAPAMPPLDWSSVLTWVDHYSEASLAARFGFVAEHAAWPWLTAEDLAVLERRRPRSPRYLMPGIRGGRLIARWNLIVPPGLDQARGSS